MKLCYLFVKSATKLRFFCVLSKVYLIFVLKMAEFRIRTRLNKNQKGGHKNEYNKVRRRKKSYATANSTGLVGLLPDRHLSRPRYQRAIVPWCKIRYFI